MSEDEVEAAQQAHSAGGAAWDVVARSPEGWEEEKRRKEVELDTACLLLDELVEAGVVCGVAEVLVAWPLPTRWQKPGRS